MQPIFDGVKDTAFFRTPKKIRQNFACQTISGALSDERSRLHYSSETGNLSPAP